MEFFLNYLKTFQHIDLEGKIDYAFAFVFLIMERISPIRKQKFFREGFFSQDYVYKVFDTSLHYFKNILMDLFKTLFLYHLIVQYTSPLLNVPFQYTFESTLGWAVFFFILRDFIGYWVHYGFHRLKYLWYLHMFHHSPEELDWFSGQRGDFLEGLLMEGIVSLPYLFFPVTIEQVLIIYIFSKTFEYLIHSNVRYPVKGWGNYLNNNHAHWWHHAKICHLKYGQNFGNYTLIWDRLFGTYYVEEGFPEQLGISKNAHYPENFFKRAAYPYVKIVKDLIK